MQILQISTQLRIARPVSSVARSAALYHEGLGFIEIGRFEDHAGFDGIMLGRPGLNYHFEFTYCRHHPVRPVSTPEDLLVFYVPGNREWSEACTAVLRAGFAEVQPFNPFWRFNGRTFEDPDGYRFVFQNASWPTTS
jgi:catechol 2,3-dioxygenase-like lactoylglutathione lyase family enzyme